MESPLQKGFPQENGRGSVLALRGPGHGLEPRGAHSGPGERPPAAGADVPGPLCRPAFQRSAALGQGSPRGVRKDVRGVGFVVTSSVTLWEGTQKRQACARPRADSTAREGDGSFPFASCRVGASPSLSPVFPSSPHHQLSPAANPHFLSFVFPSSFWG